MPPLSPAAAAIADLLDADGPGLAAEICDAVMGEIEAYGVTPPPGLERAAVLSHSEGLVDGFLHALRREGVVAPEAVAFTRDTARVRARQGLPLEALLSAYRIAQRTGWERMRRYARRSPDGVLGAAELVQPTMAYIDTISQAAIDGYLTERDRARAESERARRELAEAVLNGRHDPALETAAGLPLQAGAPLLVAVGRVADRADLADLADRLEAAGSPALTVLRRDEVVAVLAGADPGAIAALARDPERLGVSGACAGVDEVPLGLEEARLALAAADADRPGVALADVAVLDALVDYAGDRARRLLSPAVRRLVDDPSGRSVELLLTVRAYVAADRNARAAADALHAHPNTVNYRLRRIAELTGRDPRRTGDLLELYVGARLAAGRQDP